METITYRKVLLFNHYASEAARIKRKIENLEILLSLGYISEKTVEQEKIQLTKEMEHFLMLAEMKRAEMEPTELESNAVEDIPMAA